MLTAVSLFAGIGGIDRALALAAVEIDPARRAVLARRLVAAHQRHTALVEAITGEPLERSA